MANHEKHIDDLLRDALGDYTEQPPTGAWSDMEGKLDDGKTVIDLFFAEALSDYTETPPVSAWAGMEEKLGGKTEFDHAFAEVLGDYTEVPPAGAWADMEARLDKKPRRRRGIVWFWSAAALSGLLAIGYFLVSINEQHSAKTETEVITETPVTAPVVKNTTITQSKTEEVKTEVPVATPQNNPGPVVQTPKENTPVIHKATPEQQGPVVTDNQATPVEKSEPRAQQIPSEPKVVAVQNDSAISTEKIKVDDIAAAIARRASGTVMIVKKSRYADSVAEAEKIAQQKAEEEKIKQQETTAVVEPIPVIAAQIDSIKEMAEEETVAAPDTISALAIDAINETLKNMEVKQDAIPAQIQEPAEKAVFELGALAAKAAETVTGDSEKGSLATFIGPVEDTDTNAAVLSATSGNTIPDADMIIRTPVKFDWFIKAGYETGLERKTVNKLVFAPTVQIGLTNRLSLMLQPAIKSGKVNYSQISNKESYLRIAETQTDSLKVYSTIQSVWDVYDSVQSKYYYRQKQDSLVVNNVFETRTLVEVELPVMLNYNLGKNFSIYGGPVATYSSMLKIKEQTETYQGATLRDTLSFGANLTKSPNNPPVAPGINEVFTNTTPYISEYNRAPYANTTVNKIRFGYMLGASYSYKRLSADVTVQQNLSRMNYIANPGVKNIYTQPYMRFMLGFKLNGNNK